MLGVRSPSSTARCASCGGVLCSGGVLTRSRASTTPPAIVRPDSTPAAIASAASVGDEQLHVDDGERLVVGQARAMFEVSVGAEFETDRQCLADRRVVRRVRGRRCTPKVTDATPNLPRLADAGGRPLAQRLRRDRPAVTEPDEHDPAAPSRPDRRRASGSACPRNRPHGTTPRSHRAAPRRSRHSTIATSEASLVTSPPVTVICIVPPTHGRPVRAATQRRASVPSGTGAHDARSGRYSWTGESGPSGMPSRNQAANSTIQAARMYSAYGNISAISVPMPAFLS